MMTIPDAPPALRQLLRALPKDGAGLVITQHHTNPRPDAWYAGLVRSGLGGGDLGPYPTAEAALIAGVQWLVANFCALLDREV